MATTNQAVPTSAPPPTERPTPHEDTVRLSWLEERLGQIDPAYWQLLGLSSRHGLRQAIDQAMGKERGEC